MPTGAQQLDNCLRRIAERKSARFLQGVRAATPVDTGRAQRGWTRTVAEGQITVSNAVPYIGRLNRGSSRQEPAMFVERELREAIVHG